MAVTASEERPERPQLIWTPLVEGGHLYVVESRTVTGDIHFVDAREGTCTCTGYGYSRNRTCYHLRDLAVYIAYQLWLRTRCRLLALKAARDAEGRDRARNWSEYSEAEQKKVFA